jgi:hypothetical protein
LKSLSDESFISYTNGEADVQFSIELARSQVERTAKKIASAQRDAVNEAINKAIAAGAKGLKITWSAPKIEVLK